MMELLQGFFFGFGMVMGIAIAVLLTLLIFKMSIDKSIRKHKQRDEFVVYVPCPHGAHPKQCIKCKVGVG